ncbi:MAG TPA: DUF2851 family protein, partial [Ktedonobacteraceae bacterium]|nr:DUF2851 family protein [Ktedonobacteraceae bacterium]
DVFEKVTSRTSAHEYEEDIARRWWALPLRVSLPLTNGESYQLMYAGRRGGSTGPDIRDAILSFSLARSSSQVTTGNNLEQKITGDVEIHIRATDWFAHQHHTDQRYNKVVLHIVQVCDSNRPTLRQDGTVIPTCSLNDIHPSTRNHLPAQWPCQNVIPRLDENERFHLFSLAGTLRFEMKVQAFSELLSNARPTDIFSLYDVCLIPALAEGMGFGRDRAFFHAAGLHLIGACKTMPEPLGRSLQPSPLDTHRLRMLCTLVEQWSTTSAWKSFRRVLLPVSQEIACLTPNQSASNHTSGRVALDDVSVPTPHHTTPVPTSQMARIQQLRNMFQGLGTARADILVCNVVLPFAVVVAQLEHCPTLNETARNLYFDYPGLSSNQITRAMCKQLLLKSEPKGACQQQGLHYIYAQTCREKRCHECLIGKQEV